MVRHRVVRGVRVGSGDGVAQGCDRTEHSGHDGE
ncbi:MAG: hypothetical protein RLZZ01_399, partial [Actinomycetota bacterium]